MERRRQASARRGAPGGAADRDVLETVRDLAQAYLEGPDEKEPLHHVWDFSEMDGATLDFLLATIGEGEVRITLCGGEAKVGDTGVPGLWRVENGKAGAGSFVLARLPRCVTVLANTGLDAVPDVVNRGPDVFAAPAIIEELRHQIREADFSVMPEDPVFAIELTRQPMSPGDRTAFLFHARAREGRRGASRLFRLPHPADRDPGLVAQHDHEQHREDP